MKAETRCLLCAQVESRMRKHAPELFDSACTCKNPMILDGTGRAIKTYTDCPVGCMMIAAEKPELIGWTIYEAPDFMYYSGALVPLEEQPDGPL